ncbi:hypothetical protein K2X33_12745, partial [bacterium]|nr:hypothetical protein [bacterium]
LKALSRVCDRAQAVLTRQETQNNFGPPSAEEEELRALRASPVRQQSASVIPSVRELEDRKQALRPRMAVDLRSLLRDQLS